VARRLNSLEVIDALADVMLGRGIPEHIRSDNGPEFIAHELQKWLAKVGTRTLSIERGNPRENGYCESFNGKLRDECLIGDFGVRPATGRAALRICPCILPTSVDCWPDTRRSPAQCRRRPD
jgi:transposase InsO family protein